MNLANAEFYASYGLSSQLPEQDRMEIVFSGRSITKLPCSSINFRCFNVLLLSCCFIPTGHSITPAAHQDA